MPKSATDVMHDIILSAVIDGVMALKDASKGLPNTLVRDINSVHANTTFPDLPAELQASITANVRAAFTRLLKEGYSVSPDGGNAGPPRPRPNPGGGPGQGPRGDRPRRPPSGEQRRHPGGGRGPAPGGPRKPRPPKP